MKSFAIIWTLLFSVIFWGNIAQADMPKTPPPTHPQLEMIKTLEGIWVGEGEMHGKKESIEIQYKVTSGGTAVEETFNPGTGKEMVSIYTADGKDLIMTHYCSLGNQPRMKMSETKKTKAGDKIWLKMVDATGMKTPQDPHMGALTLTLKDKDNLIQEWTFVSPEGEQVSVFSLKRKK